MRGSCQNAKTALSCSMEAVSKAATLQKHPKKPYPNPSRSKTFFGQNRTLPFQFNVTKARLQAKIDKTAIMLSSGCTCTIRNGYWMTPNAAGYTGDLETLRSLRNGRSRPTAERRSVPCALAAQTPTVVVLRSCHCPRVGNCSPAPVVEMETKGQAIGDRGEAIGDGGEAIRVGRAGSSGVWSESQRSSRETWVLISKLQMSISNIGMLFHLQRPTNTQDIVGHGMAPG